LVNDILFSSLFFGVQIRDFELRYSPIYELIKFIAICSFVSMAISTARLAVSKGVRFRLLKKNFVGLSWRFGFELRLR